MKKFIISVLFFAFSAVAFAQQPKDSMAAQQNPSSIQHPLTWITLGTQGGPAPNPQRSEPANVLLIDGKPMIIDCGDGMMERFAAGGFAPPQATTVFISHLHVDHIGGLQGLIALHWFRGTSGSEPVTVYGPPGTDQLVAGIVQSMNPTADIAKVEQPGKWTPTESVKVVILKNGSDLVVNGVRIRAVQNSHFENPPGHLRITAHSRCPTVLTIRVTLSATRAIAVRVMR